MTVETPAFPPQYTPRHVDEKADLLKRLSRRHGTWNSNHPRWRLLDALHGYVAYYTRQTEELDRLKGLYKKVSKSQKAVCRLSNLTMIVTDDMRVVASREARQVLPQVHRRRQTATPQPGPGQPDRRQRTRLLRHRTVRAGQAHQGQRGPREEGRQDCYLTVVQAHRERLDCLGRLLRAGHIVQLPSKDATGFIPS